MGTTYSLFLLQVDKSRFVLFEFVQLSMFSARNPMAEYYAVILITNTSKVGFLKLKRGRKFYLYSRGQKYLHDINLTNNLLWNISFHDISKEEFI